MAEDEVVHYFGEFSSYNSIYKSIRRLKYGLNQNFETGCPKLKIVKSLGVLLFKGDHSILRLQPLTCIYSSQ